MRRRRHPSRQDGRRLTRDSQEAHHPREVGRDGIQDACKARVVRVDAAAGGAASSAVGGRHGYTWRKVVALVDVRRAHEEEYSWTCRQKMTRQVTNTCALQYSLYGTRDDAENLEEELASTLSDLKLTRVIACPCVWQGCIKGEHIVATVHGDDITIGGERSAVELLIKMIPRKYEIKKQVIGEDADFDKIGRILNRAIKWGRDGITIEADQRHVRDILKDPEL